MKNDSRPIGVFDSGVGGLTVLNELRRLLPNESIIYLGDNARSPYGSKSVEKMRSISLQNAKFLKTFDIKMLVVACNTASAVSLDYLKEHFSFPIVGVIEGSIQVAVDATTIGRIGVIGTRQTISSGEHKRLIDFLAPNIKVFTKATPLFASIVEEGFAKNDCVQKLIEYELNYFKENEVDTLILGCTHYPMLKERIQTFLPDVVLVDPSFETSISIKNVLTSLSLSSSQDSGLSKIFVTDRPINFMEISNTFLDSEVFAVEKIDIEEHSNIFEKGISFSEALNISE